MSDKIIQGIITDMETGESFLSGTYLFSNNFQLDTIAKIIRVDDYILPDISMQVAVDCKALDSVGLVFNLSINYFPESVERKEQLLDDLKVDSVLLFKGNYGVPGDTGIILYEPSYEPVEPEFSEEEIREVFRVNAKEWLENK